MSKEFAVDFPGAPPQTVPEALKPPRIPARPKKNSLFTKKSLHYPKKHGKMKMEGAKRLKRPPNPECGAPNVRIREPNDGGAARRGAGTVARPGGAAADAKHGKRSGGSETAGTVSVLSGRFFERRSIFLIHFFINIKP
jgi:hypothetical protein